MKLVKEGLVTAVYSRSHAALGGQKQIWFQLGSNLYWCLKSNRVRGRGFELQVLVKSAGPGQVVDLLSSIGMAIRHLSRKRATLSWVNDPKSAARSET